MVVSCSVLENSYYPTSIMNGKRELYLKLVKLVGNSEYLLITYKLTEFIFTIEAKYSGCVVLS